MIIKSARCLLLVVVLFASGPTAAQIDRVEEKKLILLGTAQPLAVDLTANPIKAYPLRFRPADTVAYRDARLGDDGTVFLLTSTPSRLDTPGKISVAVKFASKPNFWRTDMLVSFGRQIIGPAKATHFKGMTFLLVHTDEAQYLLSIQGNRAPQIIEVLGASHLPSGSLLFAGTDETSLHFVPGTMKEFGGSKGEREQIYVRKIYQFSQQ